MPLKFVNPHTFLVAGRSQVIQPRVALIVAYPKQEEGFSKVTPSYNCLKSCTKGKRNVLTCSLGSLGPGIIPAKITYNAHFEITI